MDPLSNNNIPIVKPKSDFEKAVEKLDLKGTLMLLAFLSQRALELSYLETKTVIHA